MSVNIPEEILHLDFEASEDEVEPCTGYLFTKKKTGAITSHNIECERPAKVIATRACCGKSEPFCVECYNHICERWAEGHTRHVSCGGKPPRPFIAPVRWI